MSDQTGSAEPNVAVPPPPAPPPADPATTEQGQEAQGTSNVGNANKEYGVFTELTLPFGNASDRKKSSETLAELLHESAEGNLTVLVRMGNVIATQPKKALGQLGQHRELDGDYEVIAANSRTKFEKVKTKREVTVSIG